MAELLVRIGTHFFVATRLTPRSKTIVENFARKYVQWGWARGPNNKQVFSALKVYAAATLDRAEFRFHINTLNEFKEHIDIHELRGDTVEWQELPVPIGVDADLPIFDKWTDRDYQIPAIEYMQAPPPPRSKLVAMQTGKGKSYSFMRAASNMRKRVIGVMKPMYLEKWVEDIRRTYDISIEDLMVVRGSGQLLKLLDLAVTGELEAKFILISNKTMQLWIKLWERFREETLEMGYPCSPEQLYEILGAGVRLIDEVHQDFHLNFRLDLYTNVETSTSLSATLLSEDDFLTKMHNIAYPPDTRFKGPALHKYIETLAVFYRFQYPNKLRTKDPSSNNYSHHAFEQSIIRNPETCSNYMNMVNDILKGSYFVDRLPGEKCIVFFISIDMCTRVTDFLQKMHPTLKVRRYVEEDPFENLMEADISISTLQNAGTAVDIPELTTVLNTHAVASIQSNVQSVGRLRELAIKAPRIVVRTPKFLYLVCQDVPKHLEYHERKRVMLKDRVATYRNQIYGRPL